MSPGYCSATESASPSALSPHATTVYRIDRADRIVYVNEAWNEFARLNGADGLHLRVLGRSLWDFVSGRDVMPLLRDWFSRIRTSGMIARTRFRCDAPDRRRHVEIAIFPRLGGVLEVQTQSVSEEPRPAVSLLTNVPDRSGDSLAVCSWCKRARVGKVWLEIEEAVGVLGLAGDDPLPTVTHGICPVCTDFVRGQISGTRNRGFRRLR